MLKKLLKVKNIGRYAIDSTCDDLSFKRQTIIFGTNKIGKTTLVSILKSLRESNNFYITGRRTFGTTSKDIQECEILFDSNKAIYDSSWSNSNIEIFDNDFIHKNIFIADKIEQNHKAQLHKILINEPNFELQKKIDGEEINYVNFIRNKDFAKVAIGTNFNEFIKLNDIAEIFDVDIKLKENQNKQKQYHNQTKLNQLKSTTKLSFNFSIFEKDIKQNIDNKLEEKIREHIQKCWGEGISEDMEFLNSGIDKISNDKDLCPFCGQRLNNVDVLISSMKEFFSETYKNTQSSIKKAIEDFKSIDIEKEIAQFKAEGFEFSIKFKEQDFANNILVILKKLIQKQIDLSTDIKLEELSEYVQFKGIVESMNSEVQSLQTQDLNLEVLIKEESSLKLNKDRFSVDGKKKYKKYKDSEKAGNDKKIEIDQLNEKLKNSLNELFGQYLGEINEILRESHANFKIAELKSISNRSMKESFFCDYTFLFDNTHDVDILADEDKPQFKNTLSDSDKRIFAFAFFIAKLKKDVSLSNKIVILDDPFISLDEDRRDSMIDILKELNYKQIIILSHSRSFVKRCLKKFNEGKEEREEKTKLLRLNNTLGKTVIASLDVREDNDFLDGVERYLKELQEAGVSSISLHYDNIRKIIENIVKVKYGHLLNSEEERLPMKYFKNVDCKSFMKDKINENDYQENHHDGDNQPTPEELISKRDYFIDNVMPCI
jgi:wobble nucleotide-excising tRNase